MTQPNDPAQHGATTPPGTVIERAPARDRGFTIVENVMAIVLTGLITTSLFLAMWTLIRLSRFNEYQAETEAVLGGAVDALASVDYIPCPGLTGYQQYAQQGASAVGWPIGTVEISRLRYWDPYAAGWTDLNPLGADECASTAFLSAARTMQLVQITVTSPDGEYTRSVQTIITDLRNRSVGNV